jgi:ATP-binding cassette subfamily B (MDR/TAP) protein 1
MGFEDIFKSTFGTAATKAYKSGVRGSFIEGCTYGIASALIYVAEAVLFYVGAVLIARGTYTYLQMIDVLNLVVFTVTIGAQLMTFTERIAKSLNATRDFDRLLQLSAATTDEAQGTLRPAVAGAISFRDVHFAYPERPDVPVLQGLSLDIRPDECVAVVGASGSGKSTVAALLQRLYEPTAGRITLDGTNLRRTDVAHLREHVAVVSQHANLFDATIAENIAYGRTGGPDPDAVRRAAMDAHVHEFIASLPAGYDTAVGENAALISGGQAQRIQIARALARPSRVLVLDECTSALDGANQAAVLATVRRAAAGRATLVITHKLPAMRMCDRIVLIADGRVAEEGTFDELTQRKGLFSQLARGGEWES